MSDTQNLNNAADGGLPRTPCSSSFVRMFKPQFAGLVERGEKTQTVRPTPKRLPKAGDRISLRAWSDKPYRSKQRILREAIVESVKTVRIEDFDGLQIGEEWIFDVRALHAFAVMDGFSNWAALKEWFSETHGLPFSGVLIRWTNADVEARRE